MFIKNRVYVPLRHVYKCKSWCIYTIMSYFVNFFFLDICDITCITPIFESPYCGLTYPYHPPLYAQWFTMYWKASAEPFCIPCSKTYEWWLELNFYKLYWNTIIMFRVYNSLLLLETSKNMHIYEKRGIRA